MSLIKRIFGLVFFIIIVFVFIIFIWSFLPQEEANLGKISVEGHFVALRFNLDKESFPLFDEIINFRFGKKFVIGRLSRCVLKVAGYFFSPLSFIVLVDESQKEEFDYTLLIKSKKLTRFAEIPLFLYLNRPGISKDYKLTKRQGFLIWDRTELDKGKDFKSFAQYKDTYFLSTSKERLHSLIDCFNITKRKENRLKNFLNERYRKPLFIYIDNKTGIIDYYLTKVLEKTSYNFFLTIDNLDEVYIYLSNDYKNRINKGEVNFIFKPETDFKDARKDIWFVSQILKRVFEANFYQFNYNVKMSDSHIVLNFELAKKRREKDD